MNGRFNVDFNDSLSTVTYEIGAREGKQMNI